MRRSFLLAVLGLLAWRANAQTQIGSGQVRLDLRTLLRSLVVDEIVPADSANALRHTLSRDPIAAFVFRNGLLQETVQDYVQVGRVITFVEHYRGGDPARVRVVYLA